MVGNFIFVFISLVLFLSIYAEDSREVNLVSRDAHISASASAMGGAYVSGVGELSSVYWNPAGLAWIKRREFSLSMSHLDDHSSAKASSYSSISNYTSLNLSLLAAAYPFEVVRGSFVLATGYYKNKELDFEAEYSDNTIEDTKASLGRIFIASALEISKGVSLGLEWHLNTGEHQFIVDSIESNIYSETSEIAGWGLNVGLSAKLNDYFTYGLTVELFDKVTELRTVKDEIGLFENSLEFIMPPSLASGLRYDSKMISVEADVKYILWENMLVKDLAETIIIDKNIQNIQNATEASLGVEFIPTNLFKSNIGLKLRAGLTATNSMFISSSDDYRFTYSGGVALLLTQSLLLEFSSSYFDDSFTSDTETVSGNLLRSVLSISVRM